jgi:hypothetical protein
MCVPATVTTNPQSAIIEWLLKRIRSQLQAEGTGLCVTTAQRPSTQFLQVQKFHLTDSETSTLFHSQNLLILLVELVSEKTIAIVVNNRL